MSRSAASTDGLAPSCKACCKERRTNGSGSEKVRPLSIPTNPEALAHRVVICQRVCSATVLPRALHPHWICVHAHAIPHGRPSSGHRLGLCSEALPISVCAYRVPATHDHAGKVLRCAVQQDRCTHQPSLPQSSAGSKSAMA